MTGTARRLVRRLSAVGHTEDPIMARELRDLEHMRVLLAGVLATDSCCVDVGAHEGVVLADIVRLAPKGRHIAYEPLPQLADDLQLRFPGVDVRRVALSNTEGPATFNHVRNFPGYSGLRHRPYPGEPDIEVIDVITQRLDDHLPVDYVPALIKVDVEGAERLVLEGSLRTLRRHRPVVLFEDSGPSAPEYESDSSMTFDLLTEGAGLRIFDLDGNGPYSRSEFSASSLWNFVAHR